MKEYARVWKSMQEYARVYQSMPEYARVCQSMPEYARVIHAKSGRLRRYISAIFLDFPQNFRLRTRIQYCTQPIALGSTILDGGSIILDGGSTILDGSSTIFCRFSPFFVDFHHFLSIFTIFIDFHDYAILLRFTFWRNLRTSSAIFFRPK